MYDNLLPRVFFGSSRLVVLCLFFFPLRSASFLFPPLAPLFDNDQVRIVYFPSSLTHSSDLYKAKLGIDTYFADPLQFPAFIQLSGEP